MPASAPFAALANAVCAQSRAIATPFWPVPILDDDTPAWLAQRWRSNYGESVVRAIACSAPLGADARP